jgi:hypothetical protein
MSFVDCHAAGASEATVTVTAPDGIQDGDILVAFIVGWKSGTKPADLSWPAGFTEWYERDVLHTFKLGLAWKRASSESGNYVMGTTDGSETIGAVSVYRGRITTGDPMDVGSNTPYTYPDTYCRAAGVTIATAGSDLVYFGGGYLSGTLASPSGMTQRGSVDSPNNLEVADLLNQAAGATGDKDGVWSSVVQVSKHAFLVALKPATTSVTATDCRTLDATARTRTLDATARTRTLDATARTRTLTKTC